MAEFVVNSHIRSHPEYNPNLTFLYNSNNINNSENNENQLMNENNDDLLSDERIDDGGPLPIEQSLLKKYIAYARALIRPVINELDTEKVFIIYFNLF